MISPSGLSRLSLLSLLLLFSLVLARSAMAATGQVVQAAPSFTVSGPSEPVELAAGGFDGSQKVVVTPAAGTALGPLSAVTNVPWLRGVASENRPGEVDLYFDATGLTAKSVSTGYEPTSYFATLTIVAGQDYQNIQVQANVSPRTFSRAISDPTRPLVYALRSGPDSANPVARGSIAVMDAGSGKTVRELDADGVYAITMSSDRSCLYGVRSGANALIRFDLERMTGIPTGFSVPGTSPVYEFTGGRNGIVYFLSGQNSGLTIFDTNQGAVVQTIDAPGAQLLFQHLCMTPDGKTLVANQVCNGGYTLGGVSKFISYAVAGDGTLTAIEPADRGVVVPPDITDDQLLEISADGKSILCGDRIYRVGRPLVESVSFPEKLMDVAPGGEFAVSIRGGVFSADGRREPAGVPQSDVILTLMGMTVDGRIIHTDRSGLVNIFDPRAALGDAGAGFAVFPDNGAQVSAPSGFRWLPVAAVREYRVYVSKSAADLTAANPPASSLIARTGGYSLPNPVAMAPGENWSWRVDAVGPQGIIAGGVKTFSIGGVKVDHDSLDLDVAKGCKAQSAGIRLSSDAPVAWTATTDQPSWLTFVASSGTTPATLQLRIDTRAISASIATASVSVSAGGNVVRIPVTVRPGVCQTSLILPASSHQTALAILKVEGPDTSYLVRLDPATGDLLDSRPIDNEARALRLSPDQSQIGVFAGQINVPDGTSFKIFDTDSFRPLGEMISFDNWRDTTPLGGLGPNGAMMYRRVLLRWSDGQLLGVRTDQELIETDFPYFSPDGKCVFGADSSYVWKLDATSPDLAVLQKVAIPFGSVNFGSTLQASGDVSTLGYGTQFFDSDLNFIVAAPGQITGLNATGTLAMIGSRELVHVPSLRAVLTLPGSSFGPQGIAEICESSQTLLYQTTYLSASSFTAVSYASAAHIDPAALVPGTANGAVVSSASITLSWNDLTAAAGYHVFFGTDAAAVAAAQPGDPLELGFTTTSSWATPLPLTPGSNYYWKLIIDGEGGPVSSSVWSFQTSGLSVNREALHFLSTPQGFTDHDNVQVTVPAGAPWIATTPAPWLHLNGNGTGSGILSVDADPSAVPSPGIFSTTVMIIAGSETATIPVTFHISPFHIHTGAPDNTASFSHLLVGLDDDRDPTGVEECYLAKMDMVSHRLVSMQDTGMAYSSSFHLLISADDQRVYIDEVGFEKFRLYAFNGMTGEALEAIDLSPLYAQPLPGQVYLPVPVGADLMAFTAQNEIRFISTRSGELLPPLAIPASDSLFTIVAAPDGRTLYAQSFNQNLPLTRIQMTDSGNFAITGTASGGSSTVTFYSSKAVSSDGSVIYSQGGYYSKDLVYLGAQLDPDQNTLFGLNHDGTLGFSRFQVISRDGSIQFGSSYSGGGYGVLVDPLANRALGIDTASGWAEVLDPAKTGLPQVPHAGWLSSGGGDPWTGDPANPGVIVARHLLNPESYSFGSGTYLSFKAPVSGVLTFDWRNVTTGNETFSYEGNQTFNAPVGATWVSRSVSIAAGDQALWQFIPGSKVDSSASAELRNVTFTPASGAQAVAVLPPAQLDTDGDGWPDLVEIALGSDPSDPSSRPVAGVVSQNGIASFVYEHPTDSAYPLTVQISDDLLTWQDVPAESAVTSTVDAKTERVSVVLPVGYSRGFARLKITSANQ